jgi:hypothetical protein
MNDLAIAQALAARGTAVASPVGYAAMRAVYAVPQESLGATPALVVVPAGDSMEYGGQTRRATVTFTVRIYLDTIADLPRRFTALHVWRAWLRDLYGGAVTLGGSVDQCSVTSTELGTDEVAGVQFLTVDATVECVKLDAIAFTA